MNAWQRRVRLALAVFVVIFAVGIFLALRRQPTPPQPAPVPRADPTAAVESSKGVAIQFKGEKEQLKVEFQDTLIYANGTRRLKGIRVTVSERAGRSFVVTGREGDVGTDETNIRVTGDVKVVASDGLTLRAEDAFYTRSDGIVRAPGPVTFERGRMTGSAVGMTYDQNADILELPDQVVAKVAPDPDGQGEARITAGSATLARNDHQWRFARGVRVLRAGRALESDTAVAHLTDDESRVRRIEMRGGSRILGGGTTPGSLESMSARDMDLTYADDGEQLQQALLAGGAVVQIAGARGARGRRIAADWMTIGFAPDGTTVTSLTGRDQVSLDIPPEEGAPGRSVRAATLEATGAPATGITSAAFKGNVEFREAAAPPAQPRVAHAGAMTLALKPGFGAAESARFTSGVRFENGDLTASAQDGRYQVTTGQLNLSGTDERTARPPQVTDPKVTISGSRIEITLDGRKIVAQGGVNSILQPTSTPGTRTAPGEAAKAARPSATTEEHRPALLNDSQPAYVTADNLVYDGASGLAVYTGRCRLWQGDMTIQGDRLTLDDSKGDLTAVGTVHTNLVMYQTNDETKEREKVPTKGTADSMTYTDDKRQIVFVRGKAQPATLIGPEGDLRADRIEVFLSAAGDELDRVDAEGGVLLKMAQQRTSTGRRLVYTASDGRYVMQGAPVQVLEQLQEGCRITTGTTLTLFKSTDRIVADGNQERRTETKNGGKCADPGLE